MAACQHAEQERRLISVCAQAAVMTGPCVHQQQHHHQQQRVELLRQLTAALPPLQALDRAQLPQLASLHLAAASNMMAAMRALASAASVASASDGDDGSAAASLDLAQVAALDDATTSAVSVLIDLQLWHLQRAAALTAHARQWAPAGGQQQHPQHSPQQRPGRHGGEQPCSSARSQAQHPGNQVAAAHCSSGCSPECNLDTDAACVLHGTSSCCSSSLMFMLDDQ